MFAEEPANGSSYLGLEGAILDKPAGPRGDLPVMVGAVGIWAELGSIDAKYAGSGCCREGPPRGKRMLSREDISFTIQLGGLVFQC